MFDVCVQNGGLRQTQIDLLEHLEGPELLVAIAQSVANACDPKWRADVLSRKVTIATGHGVVHGRTYDLAKDYGL
jgi:hypothetical protein